MRETPEGRRKKAEKRLFLPFSSKSSVSRTNDDDNEVEEEWEGVRKTRGNHRVSESREMSDMHCVREGGRRSETPVTDLMMKEEVQKKSKIFVRSVVKESRSDMRMQKIHIKFSKR
jgi:hypothetical protein